MLIGHLRKSLKPYAAQTKARTKFCQYDFRFGFSSSITYYKGACRLGATVYRDRCFVAAHFFQNVVSPEFMKDVLFLVNRNATAERVASMVALYDYWEDFNNRSRYYAYSLRDRAILDLNGNVRVNRG